MKKRYLVLIVLMSGLCNSLYAQSIFQDAATIRENLDDTTNELELDSMIVSVLIQYFPELVQDRPDVEQLHATASDVGPLLSENPFLSFIVPTGAPTEQTVQNFIGLYQAKGLSAVKGLDVTTYADALARFMVSRAKQELSIAFFERLQNHMKENVELQVLFPQTHNLLLSIGDDIYQFNVYLTSLRDVFRLDLGNIYTNLPALIGHQKYKSYFEDFPELSAIFENSFIVLNGLSNNNHPGEIFSELSFDKFARHDSSTVKGALQTIQFLSNSLRAGEDSHTFWITRSEFERDLVTIRIYLGLLYQKEIIAGEEGQIVLAGRRLHELLDSMAETETELQNSLRKYRGFYNQFLDHASMIHEYLEEISSIRADQRTFHDYYRYFKATLEVFEKVYAFAEVHGISIVSDPGLEKFTHTVHRLNDLYLSIHEQNYGSAIAHTISILDTLLADQFEGRNQFFRYGSFMANVATATSSEEVQHIIEATVLPPGSYRAKRNSKFTVSVNSYLGANVLFSADEYDIGRFANHAGFYAPVGVEGSFSSSGMDYSISLFFSIVDLGAITRYRLNESDGRIDSTIRLGSIISPGASFIIGLPDMPISAGVSYSSQPSLQYDDSNEFITINRDQNKFGFSGFITVDIPLFNVYLKPR